MPYRQTDKPGQANEKRWTGRGIGGEERRRTYDGHQNHDGSYGVEWQHVCRAGA
jgi:hypothetical protein